jgi:DNA (cytosine-5)-methyltransferase 1
VKVLDLFSGIGGFSLGLERAGMETVAFCEFDKHAQKVLKKHWPDVPIYDDVRTLDGKQFRGSVDVVCGGFPCQDLSVAGKKAGFDGARSSLYREMLRIIGECMPRYAIFENVTGLLTGESGRWFGQFLYDLAEIGFDAEWHCIPASELGAHHHRDRVWIIAHAYSGRLEGRVIGESIRWGGQELGTEALVDYDNKKASPKPEFCRGHDGIPKKSHRLKQLGNAVVPQIPEAIGRAIMEASKNG